MSVVQTGGWRAVRLRLPYRGLCYGAANARQNAVTRSCMMRGPHPLLLLVVLTGLLGTPAAGTAQSGARGAAFGVRVEYISLGGGQFSNLTSGAGVDGFVRVLLGRRFAIDFGAAATGHREHLLCTFHSPCIPIRASLMTSVYLAPAVRQTIASTQVEAYGALRTGLLFGTFQDRGPALEAGLVGGVVLPVFRHLSADVSALGSLAYVGTNLPRSGMGTRVALRVGLVYALGVGSRATSGRETP